MSGLTPPQTVGPFFSDALLRDDTRALASPDVAGRPVRIDGQVRDGEGAGIPDAMVEVWQADARGRYRHPDDDENGAGFVGWGRAATDDGGHFWFTTVVPGAVPLDGATQAPHLVVQVFARGLLDHLTTRMYFADDPRNEQDPALLSVPAQRRSTLLAQPAGDAAYHFDIVLQGADETVFFDVARRRGGR